MKAFLFEENDAYLSNYSKALDFMTRHADEPTVVFLYSVHTDHADISFNGCLRI